MSFTQYTIILFLIFPFSLQQDVDYCGVRDTIYDTVLYGSSVNNPLSWPWMAAIFIKNESCLSFVCGGTLVANNMVITAAHCILGVEYKHSRKDIIVFLGRHRLHHWGDSDFSKAKLVRWIIPHPSYLESGENIEGDFVILVLEYAVTYTSRIKPICLPTRSQFTSVIGHMGTLVGWGTDHKNRMVTSRPKLINLPIVSNEECVKSNPIFKRRLTENVFCAGFRNGSAPCSGDSGSGLYVKIINGGAERWFLVGVDSQSVVNVHKQCKGDEFSIFTNVVKYLPWIKHILVEYSEENEGYLIEKIASNLPAVCKSHFNEFEKYHLDQMNEKDKKIEEIKNTLKVCIGH